MSTASFFPSCSSISELISSFCCSAPLSVSPLTSLAFIQSPCLQCSLFGPRNRLSFLNPPLSLLAAPLDLWTSFDFKATIISALLLEQQQQSSAADHILLTAACAAVLISCSNQQQQQYLQYIDGSVHLAVCTADCEEEEEEEDGVTCIMHERRAIGSPIQGLPGFTSRAYLPSPPPPPPPPFQLIR